ncbi:MAG: hypothetical protein KIT19_01835 [Phycisphaeraceae bacterium]|nr:hypothetical protein [Phycisphaeraceae bacterium]
MWLTEPEIREKMLLIEKGGCAHTRMAASVTLASTVGVLQTIIDDYTEARAHARQLRAQHEHLASAASRHDPLPPSHLNQSADRAFLPGEAILGDTSLQAQRLELRRAEGARRACHHLYRLSRIVPIDDSILARAAELHRTARVIERTSPSDSSPPGTTPGGTTLQTGAPAARATDTPRVRTPDAASPPLPLVPSSSSPRSSASSAFNSSSDSASSSASSDSSDSSPEGRTVRCHGFQPVESGPIPTSSSCASPPPGRTTRFIDEDADPRASDTPAPVPRPHHAA